MWKVEYNHSPLVHNQITARYLANLKGYLQEAEITLLQDFPENYNLTVQDEIQG